MKCPSCGHITIFKTKYCPECGAKFDEPDMPEDDLNFNDDDEDNFPDLDSFEDEASDSVEAEEKASGKDTHSDFEHEPDEDNDEEDLSEKANDLRLKMGIIGGAVVVALAFIILFIILLGGRNTNPTVNPGNTVPTATQTGDKTADMKAAIDDIRSEYLAGNISFEEADKKVREYYSEESVREYAEKVHNEIYTENEYRNLMVNAERLFMNEDFKGAVEAYRSALDKKETDEAKDGLDKSVSGYVGQIKENVKESTDKDDYDNALAIIGAAIEFLPGNEDLTALKSETETAKEEYLQKLHEEEMNGYVAEAQRMVEKKKWDDAFDFIKEKLKEYPDDEILMKEYDYIKANMPMHLANVEMYDAKGVRRSTHSTEDKNGKSYSNYVRFAATDNASAKFKLNGAYTEFTATIFIPDGAKAGKNISVYFYLDDKVVGVNTGISENYEPLKVHFSVSGGKVLEIVTKNEGTSGGGFLMIAGSSFKKK